MTVLWILGILSLLLMWLCLTRVGAQLHLEDGSFAVDVRIGLFHFRVFPGKEKKKRTKKASDQQLEEPKKAKEKKRRPKITLADIRDAVKTLWPPLKRALDRTRRGIRIDPMELSLTLGGGDDPAAAAELYGYLHAGVWTGMPVLEKALDIPRPYLHIGIDYDASKPILEGKIGITARIGTLLAVVIGIAIPALRWFLKFQKNMKQHAAPQPAA